MSDPIGSLSGSGIVYGASQSQGDFDIGTMMMMLSLERADRLEGQLKDQANQMKQVNEQIKMTNFFMAEARGIKDEAGTYSQEKAMYDHFMGEAQEFRGKVAGGGWNKHGDTEPFTMPNGEKVTMQEWADNRGISLKDWVDNGDDIHQAGEWDILIKNFKAYGDDLQPPSPREFTMADGTTVSMADWAKENNLPVENGISKGEYGVSKQDWDSAIEHMKAHADGLNSTSQLEMIRLQSLTNKRNQAFEMSSNIMNKLSGVMDKVISNMR
ncbi:hypothetical protein [Terasakiella pusilla]|uniref:hypothetical protein n=1 Tax=Terasakiella pusilla TaxID=64973 RepID=UPI003AA85F34